MDEKEVMYNLTRFHLSQNVMGEKKKKFQEWESIQCSPGIAVSGKILKVEVVMTNRRGFLI